MSDPSDFAPALGAQAALASVTVSSNTTLEDIENSGVIVDNSPRGTLNFIPSTGIGYTITDDSSNDKVSVTTTNSMITTITTAGDTLVGTGNATVKRLALGTANQVYAVNGAGTDVTWATKTPIEVDYVQDTNIASIGTLESTVLTGTTLTYVNSAHLVTYYAPRVVLSGGQTMTLRFYFDSGNTEIGQHIMESGSGTDIYGVYIARRYTPAASTKSFTVTAVVSTGSATIEPGTGGSGNRLPMYLRVVRLA